MAKNLVDTSSKRKLKTDKKYNEFPKKMAKEKRNENTVAEESLPIREQFESSNEPNSQEYPTSVPSQSQDEALAYQTNLFSYEDAEYPNYHFGLIRGYHREMYEEPSRREWFLCCQSVDRDTADRIRRKKRVFSYQLMGVLFGAIFVFFGITSLIVTIIFSDDEAREYLWHTLDVPSKYIHVIAIVGLTVLALGSALISLCLLVPECIGRPHRHDAPRFWCTTGDLYIKHAEEVAPNQFLYFDATLYGDFVGHPDLKKVQPELKNEKN